MDRMELLGRLLKCSIEDDNDDIDKKFGSLIHEFKPLYVFYDILKEVGIEIVRFQPPLIEGDEVTFQFVTSTKGKTIVNALQGTIRSYKDTDLEFLISVGTYKKGNVTISLSKVLK